MTEPVERISPESPSPAPATTIATACPSCGSGFRLPAAALGRASTCPSCRSRLRIVPTLAELVAGWGLARLLECGFCKRAIWLPIAEPSLDLLCSLCHTGRLTLRADARVTQFEPVPAGDASLPKWDDVPRSCAHLALAEGDAPAAHLEPHARLAGGRYEVRALLRRDRVSAHYAARDLGLGRDVTLQVFLPSVTADPDARGRLESLAGKLTAIRHPALPRFEALLRDDERGLTLLAAEVTPGIPLSSCIHAHALGKRRVDLSLAVKWIRKVLAALEALHATTRHGWALPENVLLTDEGEVCLVGLCNPAQLLHGTALSGAYSTAMAAHFAPEQFHEPERADHRADLFTVAAVLYELLAGEVPRGRAPPPSTLAPEVPKSLDEAVIRGLDPDPARRFPSARSFLDALDRVVEELAARPAPVVVAAAAPAPAPAVEPGPAPERAREARAPRAEERSPERPAARRDTPGERVALARQAARRRTQFLTAGVFSVVTVLAFGGIYFLSRDGGGSADAVRLLRLAPADGAWVRESEIEARGQLSTPAPAEVLVNGQRAAVDGAGTFAVKIALESGRNEIEVRTRGAEGRSLARQVVLLDAEPPRLVIDAPARGSVIGEEEVRVSGQVVEANPKMLIVGERPVRIGPGGRFEAEVPLAEEGRNVVRLTATDQAGNEAREEIELVRDTRPPLIEAEGGAAIVTRDREVRLRVRVSDPHLAKVRRDGAVVYEARGAEDWTLDAAWALRSGANETLLEAEDALGHRSTLRVQATCEAPAVVAAAAAPVPAPAPAEAAVAPTGTAAYLWIPLVGEFGKEITAEGFEKALDAAAAKGIQHVVIYLDSPGGMVYMAEQIRTSMTRRKGLVYHCVVKRAISASIWVVFASDSIHVLDGAAIGGAVVYSGSISSGNVEVDAKLNSIVAAELIAQAEAKGHPGALVRPMIEMEATVYAWRDASGKVLFSEQEPPLVHDFLVRDGPRTVLTLTAEQAAAVGLARKLKDPDELGRALGFAEWKKASDAGERAMEAGRKSWAEKWARVEKELGKLKDALADIKRCQQNIADCHPNNGKYFVNESGYFTTGSVAEWRSRTDKCVDAYQLLLKPIATAKGSLAALDKLGFPLSGLSEKLGLDDMKKRAQVEISGLLANRGRDK
jgi:serine/threonine-protein kinase